MGSVGFRHGCGETGERIAGWSDVCKLSESCVGFDPCFGEADEVRVGGVDDV